MSKWEKIQRFDNFLRVSKLVLRVKMDFYKMCLPIKCFSKNILNSLLEINLWYIWHSFPLALVLVSRKKIFKPFPRLVLIQTSILFFNLWLLVILNNLLLLPWPWKIWIIDISYIPILYTLNTKRLSIFYHWGWTQPTSYICTGGLLTKLWLTRQIHICFSFWGIRLFGNLTNNTRRVSPRTYIYEFQTCLVRNKSGRSNSVSEYRGDQAEMILTSSMLDEKEMILTTVARARTARARRQFTKSYSVQQS